MESAGNLTLSDVLDEMKKEDTGLRAETLKHAVDLFQRTVSELVLNGYSVNTGLFRAVPQFRGVIDGGVWNPREILSMFPSIRIKIYVKPSHDTGVKILGAKGTRPTSSAVKTLLPELRTVVQLRANYRLQGKNIKVTGTDAAVGIVLIDEKGTETKLPMDMIAVNNPSEVLVLLPADLKDEVYELRLTTQFSTGNKLLKVPRTVIRSLVIGLPSGGDGDIVDDPTA